MVATVVVMELSVVCCPVALVPNIRKFLKGSGLLGVDPLQEPWIDRPAVAIRAPFVDFNCPSDLRFMGRHDVDEVSDGLGRVFALADVDVDAAAARGAALRPGPPQNPEEFLPEARAVFDKTWAAQDGLTVTMRYPAEEEKAWTSLC